MSAEQTPILEVRNVSKYFGGVVALKEVSMDLRRGEVMCLLGDNGAGKSTLIKILSGVYPPDEGEYLLEGKPAHFTSPRDALEHGIATVYQDLAMIPLMSITRNFFLGSEPTKGRGLLKRFDIRRAMPSCARNCTRSALTSATRHSRSARCRAGSGSRWPLRGQSTSGRRC